MKTGQSRKQIGGNNDSFEMWYWKVSRKRWKRVAICLNWLDGTQLILEESFTHTIGHQKDNQRGIRSSDV